MWVCFLWSFIGGCHVILGHKHHVWGDKSRRVRPKGCIMRTKVHSVHTIHVPLKQHSHKSFLLSANSVQRNAHCKSLFFLFKSLGNHFFRHISSKVTFSTLIELSSVGFGAMLQYTLVIERILIPYLRLNQHCLCQQLKNLSF